jgi:preprotein translocase subunit YajC
MTHIWLLATAENGAGDGAGEVITMEETGQNDQAVTQQDGSAAEEQQQQPQGLNPILLVMLPLLLIYIVFMLRGPRKKQQEHQKMVAALSKNDRVRTIGGIFGTVLDVRDDEIVLKIDESTNAKMRVSPSAIATVLKDTKNQ